MFNDIKIIKGNNFKDKRGILWTTWKKGFFKTVKFNHDKFSLSKKNTLRGLHLQKKRPQAKIITVANGEILDVVVDLRKKSKTYGKYFSIKISQYSDFSLFIPEGFAHGFLCLTKTCTVYYKCTNYRHEKSEITIKWNDSNLKIKWPIKKPIISKKDKDNKSFSFYFE